VILTAITAGVAVALGFTACLVTLVVIFGGVSALASWVFPSTPYTSHPLDPSNPRSPAYKAPWL
jgi:hypothetical protein